MQELEKCSYSKGRECERQKGKRNINGVFTLQPVSQIYKMPLKCLIQNKDKKGDVDIYIHLYHKGHWIAPASKALLRKIRIFDRD